MLSALSAGLYCDKNLFLLVSISRREEVVGGECVYPKHLGTWQLEERARTKEKKQHGGKKHMDVNSEAKHPGRQKAIRKKRHKARS